MWFIDCNREQLLDYFHSGSPIVENCVEGDIWKEGNIGRAGLARLVWDKRPIGNDFPSLIVVPNEETQEFFAWANTYLPGWRPVSSLIRVISNKVLREMDLESRDPHPLAGYENCALGLVVSEALTHTAAANRQIDGRRISFGACKATCSFGMGRSIRLGRRVDQGISHNWFRARKIVNQPTSGIRSSTIFGPWAVLSKIGGSRIEKDGHLSAPDVVYKMCKEIHGTGVINKSLLGTVTRGWPDLRGAFLQMNGPWEERVRVLDRTLSATMQKRKSVPDSIVFVCGLLASRVAPGTLDHASLLVPYLGRAKGLLLWYGLCAGLVRGSKVMELSENLGRRISQDMLADESVFSKPRCDISLEELEVLSVSTASMSKLKNDISGQLSIEIFPCVTTVVRWRAIKKGYIDSQQVLLAKSAAEVGNIIGELNRALEKARRRLHDIRARR